MSDIEHLDKKEVTKDYMMTEPLSKECSKMKK